MQASDSGLASYVAGQIDRTLSWKVHYLSSAHPAYSMFYSPFPSFRDTSVGLELEWQTGRSGWIWFGSKTGNEKTDKLSDPTHI